MRRRRRKMLLRISPYILMIMGVSSFTFYKTVGEDVIENYKYERLQESLHNNNDDEELTPEETDEIQASVSAVALPQVPIDVLRDILAEQNAKIQTITPVEEIEEVEAEEVEVVEEEILPTISDELLASGYEFQDINFDELLSINDDSCAWLTIDGTNIDYPIMYAPNKEDNYYLHRDIYGNDSSLGTLYIFSDSASLNNTQEDLSDMTLVFGHHVRGGKMFDHVFEYYNQSYYDGHPFGVIYTPDGYAFKVSFFAGIITSGEANSDIYRRYFEDEETYNEYINFLKSNSTFTSDVDLEFGDKIIGLVTCEYTAGTNSRYVLYGVLDKQYIKEEQIGKQRCLSATE
ncbi:MAG: class B sortase [Erysipelotrichales bacterium]|nr:class B sortase [Erysipelotrichales bacterium]